MRRLLPFITIYVRIIDMKIVMPVLCLSLCATVFAKTSPYRAFPRTYT